MTAKQPNSNAKPGKVKGTAKVSPAASREAEDSSTQVAPAEKPGEGEREHSEAYRAGYTASQRGTPNRPPLGYSDAEVKAWYAGYKAHANPNATGQVEGIDQGYRKNY